MKTMTIRWIRRCFIVLAAFVSLAGVYAVGFLLFERHRFAEFNRTVEAPLTSDPKDPVLTSAHELLRALDPPPTSNGLEFVVMPSFGTRWFAVSLSEHEGIGRGRAMIYNPMTRTFIRRDFNLPEKEIELLFERWDGVADEYSGEPRMLTDGNPLAFERKRGSRFSSGEGNSPCHYDVLGDIAAQQLVRYIPEISDLRVVNQRDVMKSKFCNPPIFQF